MTDDRLGYGGDARKLVMEEIEMFYEGRPSEPVQMDWGRFKDVYKPPRDYCVYVLGCEPIDDSAYGTDEYLKEQWRLFTEDDSHYNENEVAKWAWAAYYSPELYYVGYTSNPYERMLDHQADPEKSSVFLGIFPPLNIEKIDWYRTQEQAEQAEIATAEEYGDSREVFVYQA